MRYRGCILIVLLSMLHCISITVFAQIKNDLKTIDSGYAAVNRTKLYYEVAGEGQPIIFIHGSFGDRRHWDQQFIALSKKYKVVRYDVRGYGKSALPNPDEAYKDVDDLNTLMEFLGIQQAHICGFSMGSVIGIDFALAYPDKCLSLIPIGARFAGDGTGAYKTPNADTIKSIIAKTTEILKSKGPKEATDYLWTGNHVMRKGIVSSTTRNALLKMGYEYSWWRYMNSSKREYAFPTALEKLSQIRIPTLVVTAEYDFGLCQEVAAILAQQIPGANLISIKEAGHMMNMDRPVEFNRAISSFIDKIK